MAAFRPYPSILKVHLGVHVGRGGLSVKALSFGLSTALLGLARCLAAVWASSRGVCFSLESGRLVSLASSELEASWAVLFSSWLDDWLPRISLVTSCLAPMICLLLASAAAPL